MRRRLLSLLSRLSLLLAVVTVVLWVQSYDGRRQWSFKSLEVRTV